MFLKMELGFYLDLGCLFSRNIRDLYSLSVDGYMCLADMVSVVLQEALNV